MSYLVDTDVIIDSLHAKREARALFERLTPLGLSVSIISLGELYEGTQLFPDPDRHLRGLRQFLDGYPILNLTDRTMERFARERFSLRRQGRVIPDFALLIAATALVYDLILVTRNSRHFERIPGLRTYHWETGNAST